MTMLGGKIDGVIGVVGGLQDASDRMVTKKYSSVPIAKENQIQAILQWFDQERVATISWIQRLEGEIPVLKQHLHLV